MNAIDPRAALRRLAEEGGTSLAALSALLGRNAAYLQQYVTRGSPRSLDPADRRRLADFLGVDEGALGAEGTRAGFVVPRLDVTASAGPGAFADSEIVTGADVIDPALARRLGLVAGQAGIIRVRGNSMEPGLVDGDLIVVDLASRTPAARSAIYVIRIDGATMVKRVVDGPAGITATSDNPTAAAVTGSIDVIGKVVWLMREPR